MHRPTQNALIMITTAAAFLAGATEIADAGDPEESPEAAAPGPAPALAIWNTETPTADVDGLRFSLDGSTLSIEYLPWGERRFDYDIRCEIAMGSPMSRVYMPPQLVFEKRVQGQLATTQRMAIALDLTLRNPDGDAADADGMYDTVRVTIRPRGAAPDVAPVAMLQVPRT